MTAAATLSPVEIFKPGRHTPLAGGARAFTAADLKQAAAVYSPALHRAPFVVGHPKTDDVAYGHAAGLSYSEERQRLIAEPADVEPAFAELVANGRLLAVSASFYTPDSPANPVPGSYYLRHVGFLGAEPPAVKGLKRPGLAFAEGDLASAAQVGVIEFGDWTLGTTATLFRQLRDWFIGQFGQEEADKALPPWSVQALADEAVRTPDPTPPLQAARLNFAERTDNVTTPTKEQLDAQAAQLKTEREALDRRQAELDARDRTTTHAARLAEFSEFTAGLVQQGRMLPAHKAGLVAVLASLPQAQVVEFAEGDTTVSKPAIDVLKAYLAAQPKVVDFSERAAPRRGAGGDATGEVDMQDAQAIQRAALEFQEAETKAGRTVSVEAAVQHIVNTNTQEA